jgi:hypothetical protein
MDERAVVEVQIGRPPRSAVVVAARCHLGLPVATEVPPLLDDGTPFPTRYWLSCPLAVTRVARLEAAGGVAAADRRIASDPKLASEYEAAMERYRRERDAQLPTGHAGPVPRGGVGGSSGGVKCLHAHYADTASGNENPVGASVASQIEPLDCTLPCVAEIDGRVERNREWSEPA